MKRQDGPRSRTRGFRAVHATRAIMIIVVMMLAVSAAVAGGRSPWFLGYALSSSGFDSGACEALGRSPGERLSYAIFLEPFDWPLLSPSVSAGVSGQVFPWKSGEALFEARLGARLFSLRDHPLAAAMHEDSAWAPVVWASWCLPLGSGASFWGAGLSPLRFETGDAGYAFLTLEGLFTETGWVGSRLGLFDFSFHLF